MPSLVEYAQILACHSSLSPSAIFLDQESRCAQQNGKAIYGRYECYPGIPLPWSLSIQEDPRGTLNSATAHGLRPSGALFNNVSLKNPLRIIIQLKKPSQIPRFPIHHNQLPRHLSLPLPLIRGRVPDLGRLNMKPFKHPPNVWMVVDAYHHLPLTPPHKISHALVIFKREVHTVPRRLPVRRVHVVEGMWPVVALCALKPRQVFNVGAGKALPGG